MRFISNLYKCYLNTLDYYCTNSLKNFNINLSFIITMKNELVVMS